MKVKHVNKVVLEMTPDEARDIAHDIRDILSVAGTPYDFPLALHDLLEAMKGADVA